MSTDPWPTPADSTYLAAARARATLWGYDKTLDPDEFEEIVTMDAQELSLRTVVNATWQHRLPTPDAYAAATRALDLRCQRVRDAVAELRRRLAHNMGCGRDGHLDDDDLDLIREAIDGRLPHGSQVAFCTWCPDPTHPSPAHHPGGQPAHQPEEVR